MTTLTLTDLALTCIFILYMCLIWGIIERMNRVNIYITSPEVVALRELSLATEVPFSELIRRAIDRYVLAPDVLRSREDTVHASCGSDGSACLECDVLGNV